MAYDPYSRGDNPWLGNLDMPKSQPAARPGASRAASLPAAKKKPPALSPQNKKIAAAMKGPLPPDIPLPPRRPVGIGEMQGPPLPAELRPASQPSEGPMPPAMPPPMPPTRPATPGADAALRGANPPVVAPPDVPPPNIPTGMLAGGPAATSSIAPPPGNPGFSTPRTMQGSVFDTGPVTPLKMPQITPNAPLPPRPTGGPQGTPFDTGPVSPMKTPDWLSRMFAGRGFNPDSLQ